MTFYIFTRQRLHPLLILQVTQQFIQDFKRSPVLAVINLNLFCPGTKIIPRTPAGIRTVPFTTSVFYLAQLTIPIVIFSYDTNDWIIKDIPPNLKYFDFDALACTFDIGTIALYPAKVREVFDKKLSPSWQWQARYLDIFGNTEGGAIPSSIEAAAPYTPLNVTNFNKNLNGSNNNLQSLADKVDELDCGPAIYADTAKPVPDDADLFPLVDSDTGYASGPKYPVVRYQGGVEDRQ